MMVILDLSCMSLSYLSALAVIVLCGHDRRRPFLGIVMGMKQLLSGQSYPTLEHYL